MDKETNPILLKANFDYLRQIVLEQSSVVLEEGKEYLAEARLLPIVREKKMESLDQLMQELRKKSSPELQREVVEAMMTNETSFFRDVKPFEVIRDLVLPDLISIKVTYRALNIWCGACSSGQEVYTLLMVMKEYFPILDGWKVRVIASDLSTRMLEKAQRGIFSQMEVNRGMPAHFLVKYFDKLDGEWVINQSFRDSVEFVSVNLAKPWPFLPPMDLILIRNVMIYFDVETKKQVLNQAANLLKPHGYLLLGGAESTVNLSDQFERMAWPQASCFRRSMNK